MFNIFKKYKSTTDSDNQATDKIKKLEQGLGKTRHSFGENLGKLMLGQKVIDDDLFEELETQLLLADVGIETTKLILQELSRRIKRRELDNGDALFKALQQLLIDLLTPYEQIVDIDTHHPFVILMVGINGAGKTTTIGKLAKQLQQQDKRVLLAAGDTFRAAAVEQLQAWGERNAVPVIAQSGDADSAAVIFDALQAAKARQIDVVIADTAGRLHTQDHLMAELGKIQRVIKKFDASAPHEVILVLDAGIGQNALAQVQQFSKTVPLTGLTLTKLDGTAKGGVIFNLTQQTGLPVRFIGVGEGIDDLQVFAAKPFVRALFN